MRKNNLYKPILYVAIILMIVMCFSGCRMANGENTESENTETEQVSKETLFMIVEHDAQEETMTLYSSESGLAHYYEYGFSTRFKDKYGNSAPALEFTEGRFVTIAPRDADGYLTEVQLSNSVWEYEKVRRFDIDEEKGVFTIADTKYSIQEEVKLFSNGKEITFSDIYEDDILTVVGQNKKILSIVVTTGHGILALKNTTVFEDSFLQLGKDIFAMITPDMELEVPEGNYTLKVAKDGWGGSTTIEILRGQTTEIDLDTMKGEGKKKGLVSFDINADNVEVYVDYQLIDHSQPVELAYGTHVLKVEADGYDTWKKYLSVNSPEATLIIELLEDGDEMESEVDESESGTEETQETEEESTTSG